MLDLIKQTVSDLEESSKSCEKHSIMI